MFKNFLKITFRSLWKNKTFVFINVLGMGISLACCIVAYLNYDFNDKFDHLETNLEKTYRIDFIREFQENSRTYGIVPFAMGQAVRDNVSDIEHLVRYIPGGGSVKIKDDLFFTRIRYVDDSFFKVFSYDLVAGTLEGLNNKSKIFISEETAEKLFGKADPVGQDIQYIQSDGIKDYTVAGVFKNKPHNSTFAFDEAFTNYDNYYDINPEAKENEWRWFNTVFFTLNNPDRLSVIEDQLQEYVAPQNNAREDFKVTRYTIEPFKGMAVRSEMEDIGGQTAEGLPVAAVFAPVIMAVLILLIACFNFTNTSIAISSRRLKEIGLRKVMGGRRKQIVFQFLSENILLCLFALMVGLIVAEFLVPAWSEMWPFITLNLSYTEDLNFLLFLVGLLFLTGIIAGSYPAFYISKFQATTILKGTLKFGGTNRFTQTLLTLQFGISLIAIISGIAFVQNAKYQEEFNLGFERDGVIYSGVQDFNEFETYKNLLNQNPKIKQIGGSEYQIFGSMRNDPIRFEDTEIETDILHIGDGYMEAMGITVTKGRGFNVNSETDRMESVLVSENFVKEFGWIDPIGKRLVWADTVQFFVVGVIKDMYTSGLWDPTDPMMIRYIPKEDYKYLTVRTDPENVVEVNEFMEDKWKEINPNLMYNGQMMDEEMAEAATVNENIVKLFLFLGVVATILSAIGLFTLVSLNIIKRMKEIGVRKVLGASIVNIARKLNNQFIIILLVASVLGSLAGSWLTQMLMGQIWAYHMEMNIMVFVISVTLMFIISGLTIGFKIFKAASLNPAITLRDE